jgi:hypothetical protein
MPDTLTIEGLPIVPFEVYMQTSERYFHAFEGGAVADCMEPTLCRLVDENPLMLNRADRRIEEMLGDEKTVSDMMALRAITFAAPYEMMLEAAVESLPTVTRTAIRTFERELHQAVIGNDAGQFLKRLTGRGVSDNPMIFKFVKSFACMRYEGEDEYMGMAMVLAATNYELMRRTAESNLLRRQAPTRQ